MRKPTSTYKKPYILIVPLTNKDLFFMKKKQNNGVNVIFFIWILLVSLIFEQKAEIILNPIIKSFFFCSFVPF